MNTMKYLSRQSAALVLTKICAMVSLTFLSLLPLNSAFAQNFPDPPRLYSMKNVAIPHYSRGKPFGVYSINLSLKLGRKTKLHLIQNNDPLLRAELAKNIGRITMNQPKFAFNPDQIGKKIVEECNRIFGVNKVTYVYFERIIIRTK